MNTRHTKITAGDQLQTAFAVTQNDVRRAAPVRSHNALISQTTRGTTVKPVAGSQTQDTSTNILIPRYG